MRKLVACSTAKTILESEDLEVFTYLESSLKPRYLLPNYSLEDVVVDGCWKITYQTSDLKTVSVSGREIVYKNLPGEEAYWDVTHLLQQVCERQFQENNLATIEASALQFDGKGMIMLGGINTGKTTLVLEARGRGFGFIANERTLLDIANSAIVGGTTTILAKKDAVKKWCPKLNLKFDGNYWASAAQDYFKDFNPNVNVPISLAVFPKLNSGFNSLFELNMRNCKTYLYKEFAALLSGNEYMLFDVTRPSPNLDTPTLKDTRAKRIADFIPKTQWLCIEGTPKYILNTAKRYLRHG